MNAIPKQLLLVLIGSAVVLVTVVIGTHNLLGSIILLAAVIVPASLLGSGVWSLMRGGWRESPALRKGISLASILLGVGGLAAGLMWYLWPGPQIDPAIDAARQTGVYIQPISATDPSQQGSYAVKTLTYGSGEDLRRPEFGDQAELHTRTVDGTPFIKNWTGLSGNLRSSFWGFGVTDLPLNGRVWYPDGDGPFPLALIVHGNHFMMDYSDPGYDYLGELLASRGIILVSVDQNFLNGSYTNIRMFGVEGLKEENDGRGWLLLEHLRQWQEWHQSEGNPFHGKVDMDRIAVMGHSRGGEGAAIAAAFNRLPFYPDDGNVGFDYNFNIRSVVAVAPSDGQYMPTGRSTPLEDVNYLVLQGSYDGDVKPFQGISQYNRVEFWAEGDWFKAAVYVDQANHGQFNTSWGRADLVGFPVQGLLNLAAITPASEQQQVAKVFISAFLEATLHERSEYIPLFQDARKGDHWLPQTTYLTRYHDNRTVIIADYAEDVDLTTASKEGASFMGENLTLWYEKLVELKSGDQQTNAVYLGWDNPAIGQTAAYRLELNDVQLKPAADSTLIFSMADGNMAPNPQKLGEAGSIAEDDGGDIRQPLDLTIEVIDGAGNQAYLPLSSFSLLQPQIEFYTLKARFLERSGTKPGEITFQSFLFPLSDFQASNPQFDPGDLVEVRFVFDRSPRGVVVVDEIGFWQPAR
ncbi:MAG: MFS transporter [Anaerolineales bacterium]|nr:MFS transporter [Anaerolineales bacterium]